MRKQELGRERTEEDQGAGRQRRLGGTSGQFLNVGDEGK
jgi:hypothetical protein